MTIDWDGLMELADSVAVIDKKELEALRDVVEAVKGLLENHEEASGACAICLSDGRGTHAEQLETALQKLEKARRG